ncbi:unnamed protein product, partial [Owenia fusiformis]
MMIILVLMMLLGVSNAIKVKVDPLNGVIFNPTAQLDLSEESFIYTLGIEWPESYDGRVVPTFDCVKVETGQVLRTSGSPATMVQTMNLWLETCRAAQSYAMTISTDIDSMNENLAKLTLGAKMSLPKIELAK